MSYTKIAYHIVISTKYRKRTIDPSIERLLYFILLNLCKKKGVHVIRMNGMEDHVHLLVDIPPVESVAGFLKMLKAESSKFMREKTPYWEGWAEGYSCFTVSESDVSNVRDYIIGQKEHHKRVSFEDELRDILAAHGIAMDNTTKA